MLFLQKGTAKRKAVVGDSLVSEKFNGERCLWDGGASRGIVNVPWRRRGGVTRGALLPSTGLWTNNGNPIQAPAWWLDRLPRGVVLDGELWLGYGGFQRLRSIVGRLGDPGDAYWSASWKDIQYKVFDAPSCESVFATRVIKTPTCSMVIQRDACLRFFADNDGVWDGKSRTSLDSWYRAAANWGDVVPLIRASGDVSTIIDWYARPVWEAGGEGIVIRDADAVWCPNRVGWVMKIKPALDGEGVIVGAVAGEGKYAGMIGSLILRVVSLGDVLQDTGPVVHVRVSGFTDQERDTGQADWCKKHPGEMIPNDAGLELVGLGKGIGDTISFRYMELSDDGVPKEARYDRTRG